MTGLRLIRRAWDRYPSSEDDQMRRIKLHRSGRRRLRESEKRRVVTPIEGIARENLLDPAAERELWGVRASVEGMGETGRRSFSEDLGVRRVEEQQEGESDSVYKLEVAKKGKENDQLS